MLDIRVANGSIDDVAGEVEQSLQRIVDAACA
jgi:hypothetical protein